MKPKDDSSIIDSDNLNQVINSINSEIQRTSLTEKLSKQF